MNNRTAMFLLGATLALGFAFSAHMISTAMVKMRRQNVIQVKGAAEMRVVSDVGYWQAEFRVRGPDVKAAYEKLEADRAVIEEFVKKTTPAEAVSLSAVDTRPVFKVNEKGYATEQIDGYVLNQSVEVSSGDVKSIEALSKAITSLLRAGVEIESKAPIYTIADIERFKKDLLEKATKNAYERARILAQHSGGQVGSLKSAAQGIFQITKPNSTDISGYGEYDTDTIEKRMKAVVTLDFHVRE